MTFERLTVIRPEIRKASASDTKQRTFWLCRCVCGKEIYTRADTLKVGRAKSCGCFRAEAFEKRIIENTKHGLYGTPEYNIWYQIKDRCFNPENKYFHCYGGRGISICAEWLDSVVSFVSDMGKRPSDRHTIERKDNNKGYCPENCIWATSDIQQNNKRNNLVLSFKGKTMTAAQWARELDMNVELIYRRSIRGLPVEDMLFVGELDRWRNRRRA